MIKRILLAGAAAIAMSASAHAYTITIDTTPPADLNFFDPYVGDSGTFTTLMGTFSGGGTVFAAGVNDPNLNYDPVGGASYMAVVGVETLDLKASTTSFSLDWGSPDSYNNLSLSGIAINGSPISALTLGNGGFDTISDLSPFSVVTFSSEIDGAPAHAFEFSLDPPTTGAAPEASTWVMLGLGFAALGFVGQRRRASRLATI